MSGETTVHVEGDVSGQVAVGEFVYQAQSIGGVINQIKIDGPPITARPLPVDQRGPAPRGFHGREQETAQVLSHLREGPVQVFGDDGYGKTFLLRHLLHSNEAAEARGGAVFVAGTSERTEDILQSIFEMFYESALPQLELKATPTQIRAAMRDRSAFIVIDDAPQDRSQLERLLLHLPGSRIVAAGRVEALLGDGWALRLGGLDPDSARQVFLEHAGRAGGIDADLLGRMVVATGAHPASLVRIARAVERGEISPADIADQAAPGAPLGGVILGIPERRVLAVLEAVSGAPLPVDAIGFVAELPDPRSILESLRMQGLVAAASPRYRLLGSVAESGPEDWTGVTLKRLANWVPSADPEDVIAAAGALGGVVRKGLDAGHHSGVIALARASVPVLVVQRRWGAARAILAAARDSADHLSDGSAQGWTQHEIGTLMACAGDRQRGIEILRVAESLRVAAGDEAGLVVTRHNLRQFLPLSGPPPDEPPPRSPPRKLPPVDPPPMVPPPTPAPPKPARRRWLWLGVILAMVVAIIAYLNNSEPTIDPPRRTTVTTEGLEPPPTVVGVGPDLRVDAEPIDFGAQEPNSTTEIGRPVDNVGDEPPEFFSVDVLGGEAFSAAFPCGVPQPGQACSLLVEFFPEEPGEYFDTLVVEWESGREEIELRGTAEFPPIAAPDLSAVIGEIGRGEARGSGELRAVIDEVAVPVVVEVRNLGGPFEVDSRLHFEGLSGASETWLLLPIGSEPFVVEWVLVAPPLPESSEIVEVWLYLELERYPGQSEIGVRVFVDSCFSEEFQPDFCRVEEQDENNNTSEVVVIDLEAVLG